MKWKTVVASLLLTGACTGVRASDYGCKVLLCLANPDGPSAVAECVPPITQLWDDLAHFRPFPTCDLAEGPQGRSYARPGLSYYDPCPAGTTELGQGVYAVLGPTPAGNRSDNARRQTLYAGIGSGDGLTRSADNDGALPDKVCVGTLLGRTSAQIGSGEEGSTTVQVDRYDRVVTLASQASPRMIDVFIDNQLHRRVRW